MGATRRSSERSRGEVVRGKGVVVLLTRRQQLEFVCWLIS
jgi:hypothetical protein